MRGIDGSRTSRLRRATPPSRRRVVHRRRRTGNVPPLSSPREAADETAKLTRERDSASQVVDLICNHASRS